MNGILAISGFWLVLVAAAYFVPTAIAFIRGHPSRWPIAIVNLLTGFTLIGWLVAAVWASLGFTQVIEAGPSTDDTWPNRCPVCKHVVGQPTEVCPSCFTRFSADWQHAFALWRRDQAARYAMESPPDDAPMAQVVRLHPGMSGIDPHSAA